MIRKPAQQAAIADVEATLDITPPCPTSSRPTTRSSTKQPPHWTEPDRLLTAHLAAAQHVT